MNYFVLLGKLGDIVLFSRLSWSFPRQISIITRSVFVDICVKYGKFYKVISIEEITETISEKDIIIDLHNKSEQDEVYRVNIKKIFPVFYATQARAKFLELHYVNQIERRNHKTTSLIEYWKSQIERFYPCSDNEYFQDDLWQYPLEGWSLEKKIDILVSFQSSTLNKMFDKQSTRYLAEALFRLGEVKNKKVVFLMGPGEISVRATFSEYLQDSLAETLYIDRLEELFEIIRNSEFVITVDNGIKHIAGMFGKKIVSIYGPTSFQTCGSDRNEVAIHSKIGCSPCGYINECPLYNTREKKCLTMSDAIMVYKTFIKILEEEQ
ncbi:TPA: glycosyltransferase family 9 protein [Streptococcus suis]